MNLYYPSDGSFLYKSLIFVTLVAAVVVLLEVQLLTKQPWTGLLLDDQLNHSAKNVVINSVTHPALQERIQAGDRVIAIKSVNYPYLPVSSQQLKIDPEQTGSFGGLNRIYAANAALYQRLTDRGVLTLKMANAEEIMLILQPNRPLYSLPPNFWISNATALVGLFLSVLMWTYRPRRLPVRLLALAGFSFAVGGSAIAVYTSRDLALNPVIFQLLFSVNMLAKPIFAYCLLALVLIYPHRLVSNTVTYACIFLAILIWLNNQLQWLELPLNTFYFGLVITFFSSVPVLAKQWTLSRDKPIERAALMWMLLPISMVISCEIILLILPTFFGEVAPAPWVAQLTVLPLYFGLILGVFRYRLFDVERWWLISGLWILSGLLVVALDFLLIWLFHISPLPALSIAIIIAAWLYFPFRQCLWQCLGHQREPHLEGYIHDFIQIFVNSKKANLQEHWRHLLQRVFSASSAEISHGSLPATSISEDGMVLLIPAIHGNYHIDLYGKQKASRLFSRRDVHLAQTLSELAAYTLSLQQAKERVQTEERNRIMRDLHDDVGANLVSMIYRAGNESDVTLAKETLTLLRETIYTLDDTSLMRLNLAIAKWRRETQQRCHSATVRLIWHTSGVSGDYMLDARQQVNSGRVLREILTNALKHAQPDYFEVRFQVKANVLAIQVKHDGEIKPPELWVEGRGISIIRVRIQELNGTIRWQLAESLETEITIPLNRKHTHEDAQ
ncbi:MAG: hypothetical protein CSB47_06240 [Proteobacteria bacterium]|nr:MAG: hypothetical protein CSB47_06240 [Pseudomonadota bacterium]